MRHMLACIDIDYPPQVQYLLPFKHALEQRGCEVTVTARDVGMTCQLLQARDVPFLRIGQSYGAGKLGKATGTLGRAARLASLWRRTSVPDLVIATGRSATAAARLVGRLPFALIDYEHVDLTIQRLLRPVVFFPDVIDVAAFTRRGLRPDHLVPFPGLKEDISFSGIDVDATPSHRFPNIRSGLTKVLLRPPTEESHYFHAGSRQLTLAALEELSGRDDVVVVLSARHPWQVKDLARWKWRTEPIVLERPAPFVSLLKAVDVVFAAGGTMVREAAYLGVPTYSLYQGQMGQVDEHLASIGRITILRTPADLAKLELSRRGPLSPMPPKPELVDDLVDEMLIRTR